MDIKFSYENFLIMDCENFLSISHCFFPVSSCKNRIMLSVSISFIWELTVSKLRVGITSYRWPILALVSVPRVHSSITYSPSLLYPLTHPSAHSPVQTFNSLV